MKSVEMEIQEFKNKINDNQLRATITCKDCGYLYFASHGFTPNSELLYCCKHPKYCNEQLNLPCYFHDKTFNECFKIPDSCPFITQEDGRCKELFPTNKEIRCWKDEDHKKEGKEDNACASDGDIRCKTKKWDNWFGKDRQEARWVEFGGEILQEPIVSKTSGKISTDTDKEILSTLKDIGSELKKISWDIEVLRKETELNTSINMSQHVHASIRKEGYEWILGRLLKSNHRLELKAFFKQQGFEIESECLERDMSEIDKELNNYLQAFNRNVRKEEKEIREDG